MRFVKQSFGYGRSLRSIGDVCHADGLFNQLEFGLPNKNAKRCFKLAGITVECAPLANLEGKVSTDDQAINLRLDTIFPIAEQTPFPARLRH
jgi:hypothetical protein